MNGFGKIVMGCIIETKASTILQFIHGLHGELHVTFGEGTWATWLYDLLKPHVSGLVVCDLRRNALLKDGNKSDRIDARKLAELLYLKKLHSVYHGGHGLRTLKELVRSYPTITKDLGRVTNRARRWRRTCGYHRSPQTVQNRTVAILQRPFRCARRSSFDAHQEFQDHAGKRFRRIAV